MKRMHHTFQEYDCVELIADRPRYGEAGVYKGMQGWICFEKTVPDMALVNFPCYADAPDIATIAVYDRDLRLITREEADDWVNERMKAKHERKPGSP